MNAQRLPSHYSCVVVEQQYAGLRQGGVMIGQRVRAARQPLAVEAEYLAQVGQGDAARARALGRALGRARAWLSAVVVVRARHRHHLAVVRAQRGVALELVPGRAVPQHFGLVPVGVVRPVEVTIQHQLRVARLTVYHLHCNTMAMLVLKQISNET